MIDRINKSGKNKTKEYHIKFLLKTKKPDLIDLHRAM